MPKLDSNPITAHDLSEYISESDDFRMELHTFSSCRAAKMQASHGGSYRDPVTGLNRQYDVRALDIEGCSVLRMAIECKATQRNHPLLVSRIPRKRDESFHHAVVSFRGHPKPRSKMHKLETYFHEGELVGKSTAQVGRLAARREEFVSADGDLYGKWTQAIASAHDLVTKSISDFATVKSSDIAATTILPILVISDGTLWVADYGDSGALLSEPHQVEECTLYQDVDIPFFRGLGAVYPVSHLLIFTKSGFDKFLGKIANNGTFRNSLCLPSKEVLGVARSIFNTIEA